jgi:mono/diheme cytochrome c family protein
MRNICSAFALLTILGATACSKAEDTNAPSQPPATSNVNTTTVVPPAGGGDAVAKAKEIFSQRCTPCHGAEGRGDGAASASLNPRPRNFHDPEWQKSVDDAYLVNIIKMGGGAVGKSAAMPGNPDLKDEAVLAALKDHIRALGETK